MNRNTELAPRAEALALALDQRTSTDALPYLETAIPIGMIGAASVAAIVFALDVALGMPLATPNALGATIFRGAAFDLAGPIEAINVFAFTLLHSALFIIAASSAIVVESELSNRGVSMNVQFIPGTAALFGSLQASILTLLLLLDIPWTDGFGFGRLLLINGLAATVMAAATFVSAAQRRAESATVKPSRSAA